MLACGGHQVGRLLVRGGSEQSGSAYRLGPLANDGLQRRQKALVTQAFMDLGRRFRHRRQRRTGLAWRAWPSSGRGRPLTEVCPPWVGSRPTETLPTARPIPAAASPHGPVVNVTVHGSKVTPNGDRVAATVGNRHSSSHQRPCRRAARALKPRAGAEAPCRGDNPEDSPSTLSGGSTARTMSPTCWSSSSMSAGARDRAAGPLAPVLDIRSGQGGVRAFSGSGRR